MLQMKSLHGGDIYRNEVELDFSTNGNPLGMPDNVREMLRKKITELASEYPDPQQEKLRNKIADRNHLKAEDIICTDGATQLLYLLSEVLQPERPAMLIPAFLEYQRAFAGGGKQMLTWQYDVKETDVTALTDRFLKWLQEQKPDLLILCNPMNPTGEVLSQIFLEKVLSYCEFTEIRLLADECFLQFCPDFNERSLRRFVKDHHMLIVMDAFTKIYDMPGIRLGYGMCADQILMNRLRDRLPAWSVSQIAQEAGILALDNQVYLEQTWDYLDTEREWMKQELIRCGMAAADSVADFIFFRSPVRLYEPLLEKKILIRDCSNYQGLMPGNYYRTAIRKHEDNEALIRAIRDEVTDNPPAVPVRQPEYCVRKQ